MVKLPKPIRNLIHLFLFDLQFVQSNVFHLLPHFGEKFLLLHINCEPTTRRWTKLLTQNYLRIVQRLNGLWTGDRVHTSREHPKWANLWNLIRCNEICLRKNYVCCAHFELNAAGVIYTLIYCSNNSGNDALFAAVINNIFILLSFVV